MTVETTHQNGVRTYRGRKLEEMIPQIRADLGDDAIIVREREGMMGGVNGFFARRCVEVDVKPGGPKIDVYDDVDEDEEPETSNGHSAHDDFPAPLTPTAESDVMAALDKLAAAPPSFAASLEEAGATARPPRELLPPAPEPVREPIPQPVAADPTPPRVAGEPTPEPVVAASPEPEPVVAAIHEPKPMVAMEPEPVAVEPVAVEPVAVEPVAVEPEPVAPEPEPAAASAPPIPPTPAPAPARLATAPPRPPEFEARPVIGELVAQGMTEQWALELTGAAAAHANPFTPAGALRDAVRATLAASLPAAAPLPSAGAAIAFVGAGGAGKTRATAALAAAYGRASTLSVSVVSLDTTKDAKQLTHLLKGRGIEVIIAGDAAGAAEMVAGGRQGGLVVIDTAGVTPADELAVRTLECELESLGLDAAYVAVPATLSMHAAEKLVETLERLQPSGIVVTHADESDHLGVAAELSCRTGIPIAYIHEGLDVESAISAPDPAALAARLLP